MVMLALESPRLRPFVGLADEIVKFAKTDDLIVMAHHDRTKGIDSFMEQNVSRDVVRNAPCAVLVLK